MDILKTFKFDQEVMAEKIYHRLMSIGVFSNKSESYEMRNAVKLYNSFRKLNKNSYGALLNFKWRVIECMKFYTSEKSIKLAREVISLIGDFLYKYELLLF